MNSKSKYRKIGFGIVSVIFCISVTGKKIENPVQNKNSIHNEKIIDKSHFKNWPFNVDKGILKCENGAVTFETNGKIYGINGYGRQKVEGHGGGFLDDIWAFDKLKNDELLKAGVPKKQAILRKDINEILELGKSLCTK